MDKGKFEKFSRREFLKTSALITAAALTSTGLEGQAQSNQPTSQRLLTGWEHYRGSLGGSSSPERDFPMFLRWHQQGHLDLASMVTERFGIMEINEATTRLEKGEILGRAILEFEH